ncbi:MAG TPA: YihY/virulence factor BrkB family protein [Opitutaceae bacterium]|nr:YihY/virulence factor BrkB family protein [Opitutaceae bacterium]
MPRWLKILIAAAKNWQADNAFKHSAAVSFYTLFSLAPITIIAVGIAGIVFGKEIATQQFTTQMSQLVGKSSSEVIQQAVTASQVEDKGWMSTAIGIGLLVLGATTVFGQLQDSLNAIWGVTSKPSRSGWIVMIVQRLISFAMVLTVGFLLLTSLVLTTALTAMVELAKGYFPVAPWLLRGTDLVIGLVIITLLFALLFKVLPDVVVRWREVWLGAFFTAVLFSIGRLLISLYLGHSTIASTYGAAGSLVALLIWIYYSCAILFYGAEFVRAYRIEHGQPVKPKETAVRVRREIIEEPIPKKRAA